MDEREFNALADRMLASIEQAFELCGADLDYEVRPGGILELEFEDGGKIIINRHNAAREIWVAAKSGGFHFRPDDPDGKRWINMRNGTELIKVLERCILEQSGITISLDPAANRG